MNAKFMRKFFLNDKNIQQQAIIWNTISTVASSFQTMILTLILTRSGDFTAASIITIGYAVANLGATVGKYGVRNYQVSDVQEKYTFSTYLHTRYVSMVALVLFCFGYTIYGICVGGYTSEKAICVLLICAFRGIEAFEDVFHGRLQQMNRLDIAMRILAVRNIVYVIEFIVIYAVSCNLLFTLTCTVITEFFLMIGLNRLADRNVYYVIGPDSKMQMKSLLLDCLPVALSAFLLMYLGNAPKYIIDSVVTDEEQTYFNIIFMVTFAVNLLSSFVFNPFLRKMAVLWDEGNISKIRVFIARILVYIFGIVAVAMVFTQVIGRKLLGWIYGVSLEDYKRELLLLLLAGGFLAMINLMNMLYVLIRRQKVMMILCGLICLPLLFAGKIVLINRGMLGLLVLYISMLGILDITLLILLQIYLRRTE